MYTSLNQYYVVLEVQPQFWQNPQSLNDIYLHSTNSSSMIPLSAIAHYAPTTSPIQVNHTGQFPSVTLSFNLAPGFSLSTATTEINQMMQKLKMPASIQSGFAGTAAAYQSLFWTEILLVVIALFAVYVVLGILYESLIHPITIISTIPSAGVGALVALLVSNTEFGIISLIGIILLIGIVKKNAILMVDFAITAEREQNLSPHDAIFQACLLRFRPILMTTMSAMFGALPLVLSNGVGSELRKPLGIAIVGGLMLSQVLTLYTTPVVYLCFDWLRLWVKSLRRKSAAVPPPIPFGLRQGGAR
jgi:multidrug efflux pump